MASWRLPGSHLGCNRSFGAVATDLDRSGVALVANESIK
jgi:hypothetical protein